ncbi:MAG: alpha-E domain-containing protein [Chloroflexota bacterium]|nr:alpha-E domain-containing protein [Chloroflexota bacterium]
MTDPRSMAAANGTWLTDSRVYNLIWLGRWLERAEVITRAVNAAARRVAADGSTQMTLGEALVPVARAVGVEVEDKTRLAAELLLDNEASSAMHCLSNARLNASQVAPVELIRIVAEAVLDLQETDATTLDSPERVIALTDGIAVHLSQAHDAIENRWFGRESLTEEEVFHRFVQQQ